MLVHVRLILPCFHDTNRQIIDELRMLEPEPPEDEYEEILEAKQNLPACYFLLFGASAASWITNFVRLRNLRYFHFSSPSSVWIRAEFSSESGII